MACSLLAESYDLFFNLIYLYCSIESSLVVVRLFIGGVIVILLAWSTIDIMALVLS